jgi:hypothetical protein
MEPHKQGSTTTMEIQLSADAKLHSLMKMLESRDGLIRQKARLGLVEMGESAVMPLAEALLHSTLDQTRWGAAKALGEIVDIRSIPALVNALDDTDADVAWLAGMALKKFEKAAWMLLLQQLIETGVDSIRLRNGARHVFSSQKDARFDDLLEELMTALEDTALPEAGGIVAGEILKRMRSDAAEAAALAEAAELAEAAALAEAELEDATALAEAAGTTEAVDAA